MYKLKNKKKLAEVEEAKEVMKAMCKDHGWDLKLLLGKNRHRFLVNQREAIAAYLHHCGYSLLVIGNAMNRDHSTIVSYLNYRKEQSKSYKCGEAEKTAKRQCGL